MLLRIRGLWAGYDSRPVLRNVELELGGGEVLVVAGPNGAGKTTLIRCISRLLQPMRGTVEIDGEDVWRIPLLRAARLISYLPPPPPPGFNIRVSDLVASILQPYLKGVWPSSEAMETVLNVLRMVEAEDMAYRRIDELSSGELRRIMLAAVLSKPARLVLLDEPIIHLDLKFQVEAISMVRRAAETRGIGVIVATHNLTIASMLADKLALMSNGRIVAFGSPGSILRPELLEPIYGVDVSIAELEGARIIIPRVKRLGQ